MPALADVGADTSDESASARAAESRMVRLMIVATLVAIPLFIGIWMGLVAIAVSFTDVGYIAPLAMSAAVGVLSGVFWGAWMGFITFSHGQEVERKAQRSASRAEPPSQRGPDVVDALVGISQYRPSRKLTVGVASGNDSVTPALKYPESVIIVIPVIPTAASLHRNTSGYACSSGVAAAIPTRSR